MNPRVQTLIDSLQLQPHPEGGHYRETFRSTRHVGADGGRGERTALTAIYFLLEAGQFSRWHRVLSDELWSHLEGDPLELACFDEKSRRLTVATLGAHAPGTEPIGAVPAGVWQAARPLGQYTLVGCTVGPGFEFGDFGMACDHPDVADSIRALGKGYEKLL